MHNGRTHVDDGENHGDQERIVDGAGGREERSRVVETARRSQLKRQITATTYFKTYMKFTPVHCCIIWREVPRMVRRRLELAVQREPEKHAAQDENHELVGIACRS